MTINKYKYDYKLLIQSTMQHCNFYKNGNYKNTDYA